ncbi:MAG: hypothetical protein IPL08_14105 [Saprospiraceae bacterium]|nr:hypothetical protein [Saprospiraceae bacterium]
MKWLRPAPNQFRIYWDNNSKRYEPDFVVETESTIYVIEAKSKSDMNAVDVIQKKVAAEKYCQYASAFTLQNNGKSWQYLLIPHDDISRTVSLDFLVSKFG